VLGAGFAIQHAIRVSPAELSTLGYSLALNVAGLPSPFTAKLFPINSPAWSLFFEMAVNVLMGCLLIRLTTARLAVIAAGAGLMLFIAAWFAPKPEILSVFAGGFEWSSFHIGVLRTLFSFVFGMLVSRMPLGPVRPPRRAAIILWALLVAALAAPVPAFAHFAYDALFIFVVSPVLLIVGRTFEPGRARKAGALAGELSFAVYAVHLPIASVFVSLATRLGSGNALLAPFFLITVLATAYLCVKFFDLPARRFLHKLLLARRPTGERRPHTAMEAERT
jgi:peptidoglycan/LPS O-acetylase OafA/YrhL